MRNGGHLVRVLGKSLQTVALAAGFGLVGMAGAQALPFINGSVSLSDGGITVSSAAGTTSIVSMLATITQGAPVATSSTGDLTGAGNPTSAATLVLPPPRVPAPPAVSTLSQ
jgi:hypothetical protein